MQVEMHNDEIVIPLEYAAYLESLIDVFANETFPNGTAIDSPLREQTEEALNWFRKITLPNKAVKLDDDALDPELFLYAFYKLYANHFNRFQNWDQRDHFCIKVGGWIQSLLTPETAKIFCEGLYYVVEENRAISQRAEDLKLAAGESFYRSSLDSLSALGGKYLCGAWGRGSGGRLVRACLSSRPCLWKNYIEQKQQVFGNLYSKHCYSTIISLPLVSNRVV